MASTVAPIPPRDAEHVTIYYDQRYFAGWPFSHGLWAFPGGELLIGFSRGACRYERPYDVGHKVVNTLAGEYVTLRSTDGGRTWPVETLQSLGRHQDLERELLSGCAASAPATPLDWRSPDFCLTAGFAQPPESAPNVGYVQYSRDRGRSWEGPFRIPSFGFSWLQVKPTYVVRPDGMVLLFVTVKHQTAGSGFPQTRFVAVLATPDGGMSWQYLSSIVATTPDVPFVNRYYASPVLLPDGRTLVALRCQIDGTNAWPEIFESEDGGRTWRCLARVSDWGGPTSLLHLGDGRVLAVYGYRVRPFGIRARVSEDGGRTWGAELVLRDDGGSHDLGYPRVVALDGGRVLAAYYFNRADDSVQCHGGVRHIAATIFTP
ncbi:MAG: exo-alpha-sialidase [Chloroflexi bacterium]|nr:exo-alpha-sialidase [Chloroflexota bacterium]